MKYGIDAIQKYKTRTEEATLKDDEGNEIAKINMARLPVDELINYLSLFEKMDQNNPNSMFTKANVERLFGYMTTSILSANEGISSEDASEFVATNFFGLFETFMSVNGGGVQTSQIPEQVRKNLED